MPLVCQRFIKCHRVREGGLEQGNGAYTMHIHTQGGEKPEAGPHPFTSTFHHHTGRLAGTAMANVAQGLLASVNASTRITNEQKQQAEVILSVPSEPFDSFDPSGAYISGTKAMLARAESSGLKFNKKLSPTERQRLFAESTEIEKARKLVVEGQNKRLNGSAPRAEKMASNPAASLTAPRKNQSKTYSRLVGAAKGVYERLYQNVFAKKSQAVYERVLLNTQRGQVERHLQVATQQVFAYLSGLPGVVGQDGKINQQAGINGGAAAGWLAGSQIKALGWHINNVGHLRETIEKDMAMGQDVWRLVEQLAKWKASEGIYYGVDESKSFDHDLGDWVDLANGETRHQADQAKALKLIIERHLDSDIEKAFSDHLAEQLEAGHPIESVRFSGNSFNVPGLYGANNEGSDGAREAAFRVALRQSAKHQVVKQLLRAQREDAENRTQNRAPQNKLYTLLTKLDDNLLSEFAKTLGISQSQDGSPSKRAIEQALQDIDSRKRLYQRFPNVVFGPCGTLQGAMNHVGGVLTAVQHITGKTSLWCDHNGDFKEVGGLQGDPNTRTYMQLKEGTFTEQMYADSPNLRIGQDGKKYIPIDCVHSQNYLNTPGFEDEASAVLRTILSDIIPDHQHLKVKLTGTACLNDAADRPYDAMGGEKVIGSSRFAQYPHAYQVRTDEQAQAGEYRGQEELIIEGVEFVYETPAGQIDPLFVSTQHHDDASKGDIPYRDFGDDCALNPYHEHESASDERTMLNKVCEYNKREALDLLVGIETTANPLNVQPNRADPANSRTAHSPLLQGEAAINKLLRDLATEWGDKPLGQLIRSQTGGALAEMQTALEDRFGKNSYEARLFGLASAISQENLTSDHKEKIAKHYAELSLFAGEQNNQNSASSLFVKTTQNIERFLKQSHTVSSQNYRETDTQSTQAQPTVAHLSRPRTGFDGNDRNEPVLPAGIAGGLAAPVAMGTTASAVNQAVNAAALATTATVGTVATGGLLIAQGAITENMTQHQARRLTRLSDDTVARYQDKRAQLDMIHSNNVLKANRTADIKAFLNGLKPPTINTEPPQVSLSLETQLQQLKTLVTAAKDLPENAIIPQDALAIKDSIDSVRALISRVQGLKEHQIMDLRAVKDALTVITAACDYLNRESSLPQQGVDPQSPSKQQVQGIKQWVSDQIASLNSLLAKPAMMVETDMVDELLYLHTSLRDLKTAEKDNFINRITGRAYGVAGASFVASAAVAGADAAAGGALSLAGCGVLLAAYGVNYLNTLREANRTASSELHVDADHQQPWAPNVVGFHRELLARQAEQVEAAMMRNGQLLNLNHLPTGSQFGWRSGLMALGGLVGAGAATVATAGAAAPVTLPVSALSAGVLSMSGYNLANRHAARAAMYGPRPEDGLHMQDIHNSTDRKKLYWSLGKQQGQINEQRQIMLESIDKRKQESASAQRDSLDLRARPQPTSRLGKLAAQAKSVSRSLNPLKTDERLAYKLDARKAGNYLKDRFLSPNKTLTKQVRTIEKSLTSDWTTLAPNMVYTMRLYTEHEQNTLRNNLQRLEEKKASVSAFHQEVEGFGVGTAGPDSPTRLRSRDDKNKLLHKLADEITHLDNKIANTKDALLGANRLTESIQLLEPKLPEAIKNSKNLTSNSSLSPEQKKKLTANLENTEEVFKDLINEFAVRTKLLGFAMSRGKFKALANDFPSEIKLHTYQNDKHVLDYDMNRGGDLSDNLKQELQKNAYRTASQLIANSLPSLLDYEVSKLMATELRTRKPVGNLSKVPDEIKTLNQRAVAQTEGLERKRLNKMADRFLNRFAVSKNNPTAA